MKVTRTDTGGSGLVLLAFCDLKSQLAHQFMATMMTSFGSRIIRPNSCASSGGELGAEMGVMAAEW